jgi:hypothetical protein
MMRSPFISEEAANAVKRKWWFWVKFELLAWALCFAFGYALVGQWLAAHHWQPWVYWAIVGGSLLLFSRVAIWATLIVAGVLNWLHPEFVTFHILNATVWAILLRIPITLFFLYSTAAPARRSAPRAPSNPFFIEPETPESYDARTDEHVYASGRREPAYRNPKIYNRAPEHTDGGDW